MTGFAELQQQLSELPQVQGITAVDILGLPAAVTPAVRKMMRRGLSLAELVSELGLPPDEARQVADMLVDRGFLISRQEGDGDLVYKVYLARPRGQSIPLDL